VSIGQTGPRAFDLVAGSVNCVQLNLAAMARPAGHVIPADFL